MKKLALVLCMTAAVVSSPALAANGDLGRDGHSDGLTLPTMEPQDDGRLVEKDYKSNTLPMVDTQPDQSPTSPAKKQGPAETLYDLYVTQIGIRACHELSPEHAEKWISDAQAKAALGAVKKGEHYVLSKNPNLDQDAEWAKAVQDVKNIGMVQDLHRAAEAGNHRAYERAKRNCQTILIPLRPYMIYDADKNIYKR